MPNPVAILASDIHLCHKAPVARSAEPDWYVAMERPLNELRDLSDKYQVPLIIAGDVFDRWNSPPELINFAIQLFDTFTQNIYAIPGQHDLPNHNYEEKGRSAYGTLCCAKSIINLNNPYGTPTDDNASCWMFPFPWGFEIVSVPKEYGPGLKLAVVHKYIWKRGASYPGAPDEAKISQQMDSLEGYDAAVFGDNHIGFTAKIGSTNVINCGTLMRRKIDEIKYKPMVGVLMDDGSIEPHFLDTSKDRFLEEPLTQADEKQLIDVSSFLQELQDLGADSLDYRDALKKYMDAKNTNKEVREIVLQSIE